MKEYTNGGRSFVPYYEEDVSSANGDILISDDAATHSGHFRVDQMLSNRCLAVVCSLAQGKLIAQMARRQDIGGYRTVVIRPSQGTLRAKRSYAIVVVRRAIAA